MSATTIWIGGSLLAFLIVAAIGMVASALALPSPAADVRQKLSAEAVGWVGSIASVLLMTAGTARLVIGRNFSVGLWTVNGWGRLTLNVDALSAIFLFTAGLVYLSCCLFARDWYRRALAAPSARGFGVLHFALMVSVALIITAGDGLMFLLSWECMSILVYLLVVLDQDEHSASPAFVMLAMSEAGFLAVALAFLIAGHNATGDSFADLAAAAGSLSHAALWGVFLLGFFGFGVKAGLLPVNFWLPRAYTAAPAAFVPVLAGVTLNLGFYGIFRLNGSVIPGIGIGPGVTALLVGSFTALIGILYATTENDIKKMLAHSSIENAGVVAAAFGAFLIFRNSGHPVAASLALIAAFYHLVNHAVSKGLLYQCAGGVEAVAGTRDLDKLGGLIRILPALSVVFLAGCLSIAAIPPFNGFASEWLVLQSLLRSAILASASLKIVFAISGALLALTAALAVTCFVKAYAMSFLGLRRSGAPKGIEPSGKRWPLAATILATACLFLGILPTYVITTLDQAVAPMTGVSASAALVPPFFTATASNRQLPAGFLHDFHALGAQTGAGLVPGPGWVILLRGGATNPVVFAMSPAYALGALALLLACAWLVFARFARRRMVRQGEVWAGGLPKLLPEMTYSATGFSNPVRVVFQAIFRPHIVEDTRETVAGHFRSAILSRREESHILERTLVRPAASAMKAIANLFAKMHHGRLNDYVGYVLGFLILILVLFRIT